ncbi:MAG: DUF523 domain-containing protein [Eubacteriales bacterium]
MKEQQKKKVIAVSACLLGKKCRYNGGSKQNEDMLALKETHCVIPICPECLGGMKIPRPPSEILGGDGDAVLDGRARVLSKTGEDVTEHLISGAKKALQKLQREGIEEAYLKESSPSCGVNLIHDGSFTDKKLKGSGVFGALLRRNGIKIRGID